MTLREIIHVVEEAVEMPMSYVINDPEQRIYYLYLLSSAGLAYFVYLVNKIDTPFYKYIFEKKIWLSKSAFIDYFFIFFNSFAKIILVYPLAIYIGYLTFNTNEFLISVLGYGQVQLSHSSMIILYSLSLFICNDFSTYVIHLLGHKIPFLWEFHKIHHSATVLNPITQYRIHPVEMLINSIKSIVVIGVITGIMEYMTNYQLSVLSILGVNAFNFIFRFMGSNLRHSHVKLKYFNFLEYIFISPYQHQIHHSDNPAFYNKNIGGKLAIWDWMFGTLSLSKEIDEITFGLGQKENFKYNSFWKNLYMPFKNIFRKLFKF